MKRKGIPLGIDLTDIRILDFLKSSPLATGRELAAKLKSSPVSVTRSLQKLRQRINLKIKGDLSYTRMGLQEHLLLACGRGIKVDSPYIPWTLKCIGLRRAGIASILVPTWQQPDVLSSLFNQSIPKNIQDREKLGFRIWKVLGKQRSFSLIGFNLENNVWQISWQGLIRWLRHQVEVGVNSSMGDFKPKTVVNLLKDDFPLLSCMMDDYKIPIRDLRKLLRMSSSKIQRLKRRIKGEEILIPYLDFSSGTFGLPYQIVFIGEDLSENVIKALIEWARVLPKTITYILSRANENTPSGIAIVANLPSNQTPNFQDVILLTEVEDSVTIFHTIEGNISTWQGKPDLYNFKANKWRSLEDRLHIQIG